MGTADVPSISCPALGGASSVGVAEAGYGVLRRQTAGLADAGRLLMGAGVRATIDVATIGAVDS